MARGRPRKKRTRPVAPVQGTSRASRYAARAWRSGVYLAILGVLAVVLRIANLTSQSLWADEGNSVRLIERPLRLVIEAARADVHPPGYYVLLWVWGRVFGQSEVAVRSLSVAIGVCLVGLIYLIGRRWVGARAGWLAAFCAAVSPFQVMYSQEVRMYILVAFLGAAATYAFACWLEGGTARDRLIWSAAYVLFSAGGLWTHYSFPIVLAALSAAWLVWWLGLRAGREQRAGLGAWRAGGWWVGMQLAAGVLYLPWLPIAWARTWGYGPISAGHSISTIVGQSLKFLSVGETVPDDDLTRWLTVGIVGLAVFGAWGGLAPSRARDRLRTRALAIGLALLVIAPMALMVGLTLAGRPAYRPKFVLVASPAFCMLVGQGIALLEHSSGPRRTVSNQLWLLLGIGLVGVGAARSLRNYYGDPAYARADYRGMAQDIASVEREGDAVLLNAPNQWEVFTYYYRGHAPVYPVCRSRPPQEAEVRAELEAIAAEHDRLFALYWATDESDPKRIVERWLEEHAFKASDEWYGDVRLVTYALATEAGVAPERRLEDTVLGEQIALRGLRGYSVSPNPVHRGDILQVTLYWEALAPISERYKVFVHLVDGEGRIVSQVDSEPGDGMNLTSLWRPEYGVFGDRYGVLVPAGAAPGTYRLLVGMYHVDGAPRLPITAGGEQVGDALPLGVVHMED